MSDILRGKELTREIMDLPRPVAAVLEGYDCECADRAADAESLEGAWEWAWEHGQHPSRSRLRRALREGD